MPAKLWLQVFYAMQPGKVVVAGTVSGQAGLMLAILRYNESVWGLSQCSLVGFCPKEPPKSTEPQVWTSKHVKQWRARHLCLHTIERTFAAHAGHLYAAVAAPGGTAAGGTGAGAGAKSRVKAEVPDEASLGGGLPATTPTVTKFILPHGFHGKDSKLLPKPPLGEPAPDSDDPDGDAPSRDHTTKAMNKRNTRFMNRHPVRVAMSGEASGMGLFAKSDIPAETELPAKGPWFHSLDAVNTFLAGLHDETAAKMWSTRVVKVDLAPEEANGHAATAASHPPQHTALAVNCPQRGNLFNSLPVQRCRFDCEFRNLRAISKALKLIHDLFSSEHTALAVKLSVHREATSSTECCLSGACAKMPGAPISTATSPPAKRRATRGTPPSP